MTAPAVSESGDALAHQSGIVEDVIDKHTTNLIRIFGGDITYFSGRFIELGFITRDASKYIHGMGSGERGSHLLDLLVTNCRISPDKKQWFDKFVSVFSSEAAYKHLANSMTEDLEKMLPGSQDDNTLSSSHHRKREKTKFDEESSSSSVEILSSSPSSSDSEEQCHKKRKKKKHSRPSGSKYRARSSKHLNRSESTDSDSSASSSEHRTRKKTKYGKSHKKKEKSCRESDKKLRKVFKNHFGTLCCVISDTIDVAQVLRGKGLLPSSMMDKLLTFPSSRKEKVVNLVHAVERKIKSNPDHLYVFIDVLMQDASLQEVGKALWMEAGMCVYKTLCDIVYR